MVTEMDRDITTTRSFVKVEQKKVNLILEIYLAIFFFSFIPHIECPVMIFLREKRVVQIFVYK